MGTNFYVRGYRNDDNPDTHIGKRSSAGLYCWNCQITLCHGGDNAVHLGKSEWHAACPLCGADPVKESLDDSSMGRELGFNKSEPNRKKGVRGCCSFAWAIKPDELKKVIADYISDGCPVCHRKWDDDFLIEDEYGDLYTLEDFYKILEECPIRFTDSIGVVFS